jgi:hypothetical protein
MAHDPTRRDVRSFAASARAGRRKAHASSTDDLDASEAVSAASSTPIRRQRAGVVDIVVDELDARVVPEQHIGPRVRTHTLHRDLATPRELRGSRR